MLLSCVFLASLVGISSRPVNYLSAFWPANAILLGLLLRHPRWAAAPGSWLWALAGFVAADLLTGASWQKALGLNLGNLAGVLAGWLYLQRLPEAIVRLRHQRSVLHLLAGCTIAALGSALVGGVAGSRLLGTPLVDSMAMWMFSEFFNFILITPVLLSAPQGWPTQWRRQDVLLPLRGRPMPPLLPLPALLVSEVVTVLVGGPGSLGFVMPALVWCAMAYGVFPITVLNLLLYGWKTAFAALGTFSFTNLHVWEVVSLRMGMGLLSLAPLAVACAYGLRLQALEKLNHAVNHDYLTGALGRRALMERGSRLLERLREEGGSIALLMLDLDHFKQINDQHGHAQGDAVLQQFSALAQQHLRPQDLFGRLGGEEFAVLLPRLTRAQAEAVGERLNQQLKAQRFALPGGSELRVTLSAGLYHVQRPGPDDSLEQLLSRADRALYSAKAAGRDQVRAYEDMPATASA
ncbi:MAG: diguanylate cyclase [Proteobacteria bacterium]|nr:diguanylate cyclase [Pseudomonadota bacterium]